jgi:hypothetical protein
LTGGPGAGKTALLELIRQSFCSQVAVLPEAASVVFGGGFPRHSDPECQRAAQRAIYHVHWQLEITGDSHNAAVVLCDRGTLDGLAYWPGAPGDFWAPLGTDRAQELVRYDAVIHLRTPTVELGYNHQKPAPDRVGRAGRRSGCAHPAGLGRTSQAMAHRVVGGRPGQGGTGTGCPARRTAGVLPPP